MELLIGIVGGLIGAMGGLAVQFVENRAAARERRENRLVDAANEFVTAATAWSQWIRTGYTNRRLSNEEVLDKNNERSRLRQAAYPKLQLHCSKATFAWLNDVYRPLEYDVKRFAGRPLIDGLNRGIAEEEEAKARGAPIPSRQPPPLTGKGDAALDAYEKLVVEELVDRCRADVDALSRTEKGLAGRKQAAS